MTQATLEGRYAPRDSSILTRQVGDELVLVDMRRGIYHGLNAVGVQIWERLDGEQPLGQVADELAAQYDGVERETIAADTLALIQALLDNELVVAR